MVTKTKDPKIPMVMLTNRTAGPLQLEIDASELGKGFAQYAKIELGDPADAHRYSEVDGERVLYPQPEIEVPEDVWGAFKARHGAFIASLEKTNELVVRKVA